MERGKKERRNVFRALNVGMTGCLMFALIQIPLVGWLAGWLVGWLAGWLVGWLAGWLVGWLFVWLFGCLVVWLFGCLVGWSVGRLVGWSVGRLVGWSVGRLVGWLVTDNFPFHCSQRRMGSLVGMGQMQQKMWPWQKGKKPKM